MKKLSKRFKIASVSLALLTIVGILAQVSLVYAGSLSNPLYDKLNRLKVSTASGVTHRLVFKPATNVSGGATTNLVIVTFPKNDGTSFVATAGSLTLATSSCATDETATGLPVGAGSASGTLSAGANGDQLQIWGMDNLTAGTTYCVDISGNTAVLGTASSTGSRAASVSTYDSDGGSAIDTGQFAVSIITNDQVTVTATVDPSITFTLLAGGSTLNLGTLTPSAINTASSSVQTNTNAAYGYTTTVLYNNKLRIDVTNDINDTASGTVDVGYELYGMSTTDSSQTILTDTEANCTTPGAAKIASGLSTSAQTIAGATTGPVNETNSYCLAASVDSSTSAGNYSHILTFISTAKF